MRQLPFDRRAIWSWMAPFSQWGHVKKEHGGEMDRLRILFTSLMLVLTISGCATIVDGTSQPVTFNSEPNRAKIAINGVPVGVTPLTIQVKRAKNTIIEAKKDGYEPQQISLQTKVNTYFWGNILCGGFLGSTTDFASDAMVEYSPNMYFISLDPMKKSETNRDRLRYEKQVRTFILVNHAHLTQELAQGEGEYLTSLSALLAVSGTPREEIVQRIKMVSASHQDPPAFADAVLKAFVQG